MMYYIQEDSTTSTSPNSATYWEKSVQISEPVGDVSYLNCHGRMGSISVTWVVLFYLRMVDVYLFIRQQIVKTNYNIHNCNRGRQLCPPHL